MERNELTINEVNAIKNPTKQFVHIFWYDWFCKNSSLDRKGRTLLSKLRMISKNTTKFDKNKCYVFFKNNCPCYGDKKLYDDFKICDIESGNVIYIIIPRDPYGKAIVYGKENNFEMSIVNGTWNDVKIFFKS